MWSDATKSGSSEMKASEPEGSLVISARIKLTIEEAETNLLFRRCRRVDRSVDRKDSEAVSFYRPPTIHAAGTVQLGNRSADDLRIRVDAQNPFAYRFEGWEIPCAQGSLDFSVLGAEPPESRRQWNDEIQGSDGERGQNFLAPLLTDLEPFGFREPLDAELSFKLDAVSLRMISFQLVSGSHSLRLAGSLYFSGILSISAAMGTTAHSMFAGSAPFRSRSGN